MVAKEGASLSMDSRDYHQENEGFDDCSQRPDLSSEGFAGIHSPLMSIPSSQVNPQLFAHVVRLHVAPIDPDHIVAWARRAATHPLPQNPVERVEIRGRLPQLQFDGSAFHGLLFLLFLNFPSSSGAPSMSG
ncbi:hypothetical protein R1flu_017804 [Riccia fluitans]|uniref:Uncharacterized protein n=1 Tax=Riccia fluitans TaxID=41844 RepID=A0ABD1ZFC5_9MARC